MTTTNTTKTTDREQIVFRSGDARCVGYLYRPSGRSGSDCCVILAHGFGGTQEGSISATAVDFAAAGFTALTFDYRGFGVSEGELRQVVDISMQLVDWRAAISFARDLSGVRRDRIALWGSSLGGGHVLAIAAEDPAISAVVAQVPFNGFPRRVEDRTPYETRRLLGAALKDWWAGRTGRRRSYIKAVGEPGELAVMPMREASRVVEAMHNDTWRNEVAPGALIDMALWYRPGRRAKRLRMPVLLSLADNDIAVNLARPIAMRAPRGELRCYPCGHFDFYEESVRRIVVADQVSFLKTRLFAFPG